MERPVKINPIEVVQGVITNLGDYNTKGDNPVYRLVDDTTIPLVADKYLKWVGETLTEMTAEEKAIVDAGDLAVAKQAKALEITNASKQNPKALLLSYGVDDEIFQTQRFLKEMGSTQTAYSPELDLAVLNVMEANIIKAKEKYALIDEATTTEQIKSIVW